jgi:hypothetical protein
LPLRKKFHTWKVCYFLAHSFDRLLTKARPEENPFISPGGSPTQRHNPFHLANPTASPGAEYFCSPSPTSDSADGTPHTPLRQPSSSRVHTLTMFTTWACGSPSIRPHSIQRSSHLPLHWTATAKTRKKLKADDVWTFFKEVDGHNECIFCQYVAGCVSYLINNSMFSLDKSMLVTHMSKFNLSKRQLAQLFYVTILPMNILRIGLKPLINSKSPSLRRLPKRLSTHTGSDAANHKSLPIVLRVQFLMSVNILVRCLLMRLLSGLLLMIKSVYPIF